MTTRYPYLGFGVGLRTSHYDSVLRTQSKIDWLEIMTDDFLVDGGVALDVLEPLATRYPLVMHGVSMSLGGTDPLRYDYLRRVKDLMARVQPVWVSDHFCWTGTDGVNLHDLMPMPYTHEAVDHMVARIQAVQEFLGRPLVLENVSSYITFHDSMMSEWEFLTEICTRAGCLLLLDINNIYVSAFNHGFDAKTYIDYVPSELVQQFHLAGHQRHENYIIDTHDDKVVDDVWALYRYAIQRFGEVSTLIERDGNIPPLSELLNELDQAREVYQSAVAAEVIA